MTVTSDHHVAELNVGVLRHDWDDPRVAAFVDNLDRVNSLAERAPGFVWRMGEVEMEAAQTDPEGPFGDVPRLASTLSVWRSAAELRAFVYDGLHGAFARRAAEWFEPVATASYVLWTVPAGHRPTLAEGVARLDRLRVEGPGPEAFDFGYLAETSSGKAIA